MNLINILERVGGWIRERVKEGGRRTVGIHLSVETKQNPYKHRCMLLRIYALILALPHGVCDLNCDSVFSPEHGLYRVFF